MPVQSYIRKNPDGTYQSFTPQEWREQLMLEAVTKLNMLLEKLIEQNPTNKSEVTE